MHKLKYPKTNSTAKIGVDFIRSIVNYNNCIFHEINANNDLGIDAMIEIIKDEKPTGKLIATQIKSGKSYFNKKTRNVILSRKIFVGYSSVPAADGWLSFSPAAPARNPLLDCDMRVAWEGTHDGPIGFPLRVEAGG